MAILAAPQLRQAMTGALVCGKYSRHCNKLEQKADILDEEGIISTCQNFGASQLQVTSNE